MPKHSDWRPGGPLIDSHSTILIDSNCLRTSIPSIGNRSRSDSNAKIRFMQSSQSIRAAMVGDLAISPVVQFGLIAIVAVVVLAIMVVAAPRVVYVIR